MSETPKKTRRVRFLPQGVEVEVDEGVTLLAAAQKGDIYINSICGGDGVCGKCRVIVRSGEVDTRTTMLLSRDEVRQGYVLACLTRVLGDVEVFIPEETRLEEGRVEIDEDAQRFRQFTGPARPVTELKCDPLMNKLCLQLSPPSMEDAEPDLERVYRAIQAKCDGIGELQAGFAVLQSLPAVLEQGEYKATATLGRRGAVTEVIQVESGDTSTHSYAVAVDVGTTTVVAHLVDLNTGQTLDAHATYNSQMKFGEDYIARIMYVRQNNALDELQQTVVADINRLIAVMAQRNGIELRDVVGVLCSGNTAMTHLLIGLDPARIQKSPYVPSANHVPVLRAAQIGLRINPRGLIYTLPSVAAYVGSDITAGATAIRFDEIDDVSLYVDVGTNGEVVLGNKEWMMCCSASAGPAFEGGGVRFGMRASKGAVEKVHIGRDGKVSCKVIGDAAPRGICGSGLLDCLAEMLRAGIIDRAGRLHPEAPGVRRAENGAEFVLVPRESADLETDVVINQADVENLIRSKAAIYAAVSVLVESLDLTVSDIKDVYLAGGFGSNVDVHNVITIGMLPDVPQDRVHFVGNGSIAGAKMALMSRDAYTLIESIAAKMTYFDMMQNPRFMEEFVSASFLPHTNVEEFPSVLKELPV